MLAFFHKIIDVLDEADIPYMPSGSVAMSAYIVPRASRDFDFIISLQKSDVDRFVSYFQEGYYCNAEAIRDAVAHRSLFNIIDHTSGYKADFFILKKKVFRQEEFKRRILMDYFGKKVYLVSAEDLLLSKIIWIQEYQSALQMEDIKNLSQIGTLDWMYINKWLEELNLNTFNLLSN